MGSRYIVLPKEMSPKFYKALIFTFVSIFKDPGIILDFFLFSVEWSNCILTTRIALYIRNLY